MDIAAIAIKKRLVTLVLTAAMLVAGLWTYQDMSRLEDPEFTIKEALVVTPYAGASALEVEQEVSDRLEKAVANTKSATWTVDITSADRADLQAILTADPKDVADIAALFEEGKANLDATKVTDVVITPGAGTVTVKGSIINLKQLMLDGMVNGKV